MMQVTVAASSKDDKDDDDVNQSERIHRFDTSGNDPLDESSNRAAVPFTPTTKDGINADNRVINTSSSIKTSPLNDSCCIDDDASPYSLMQYYRKLCPSDEEQLLGSDSSSFELLESKLELEYLLCQDRTGIDGDGGEDHSGERSSTSNTSQIYIDRVVHQVSFSCSSELPSSAAPSDMSYMSSFTMDHQNTLPLSTQQVVVSPPVQMIDSLAPSPLDLCEIELQAERRLKLRMEAAHWQYKWEMVMARLINAVIEKQRKQTG